MQSISDHYDTIAAEAQADTIVRGSRFIAHAAPAGDHAAAQQYIGKIRQRYSDATHNCFAYKIAAAQNDSARFSDAGEPSGTAGRPILQAIGSKQLTDVVVVVTRYFGGRKLGTGGLVRAYRGAALQVLNGATIVTRYRLTSLKLSFPYQSANTVHRLIEKYEAEILESDFDTNSKYRIRLKASLSSEFMREITDALSGNIEVSAEL
jgi:uncharacterized YigZ family protein